MNINVGAISCGIFGAGAVLSLLASQYFAVAAFIVWLALFLKDVHFSAEKAFEKYKL